MHRVVCRDASSRPAGTETLDVSSQQAQFFKELQQLRPGGWSSKLIQTFVGLPFAAGMGLLMLPDLIMGCVDIHCPWLT